jgi:ArsR family transcriptional regulator
MTLTDLYKCLSDETRLRILNLLKEGPLCVCHIQAILGHTQVQISKTLATMKRLGAVRATRSGTWMIYELIDSSDPILSRNLESLEAMTEEYPIFGSDLKKRRKVLEDFCASEGDFPPTVREAVEPCCP